MKVLVTGGAGYIGAELVYKLAKNPEISEIIVYDNLSNGNHNLFISNSNKIESNNIRLVMGDLLDSRLLKKALDGVEVVYHLAAKVTNPHENADSHTFEQTNNWGTAELIYAVEEAESVRKVIFTSSTGVYGSSNGTPQTEDSALNPTTYYAISKMRAEDHITRLKGKIDYVVLRLGNVYGYSPTIRFESVINRFLFDSHFKNRIQIHGSGKQKRTFIHLDKAIHVLDGLLKKEVPSGVYNLSDKNLQILDLVDVFKEVYPNLEFIFINQHLQLKDFIVENNSKISKYFDISDSDLKEEVLNVKDNIFSFQAVV